MCKWCGFKESFKEDPSIVFHLAAFFANQNSVDYPETSAGVDVIGQIKLLEYSRISKIDKFIYMPQAVVQFMVHILSFR